MKKKGLLKDIKTQKIEPVKNEDNEESIIKTSAIGEYDEQYKDSIKLNPEERNDFFSKLFSQNKFTDYSKKVEKSEKTNVEKTSHLNLINEDVLRSFIIKIVKEEIQKYEIILNNNE